ncbi:MAG: hypothetical protein JHC33_01930 [Ignisphaera sp.]|nr:hypothetical protein [Ignisphaera sp.]
MYMIYYIPDGMILIQNTLKTHTHECLYPPTCYPKYSTSRPNKFRTKNEAEYRLTNLIIRYPCFDRLEFDIVRI